MIKAGTGTGDGRMNELYLIPDFSRIQESVALANRYGAHFEYNDFFNPSLLDDAQWVRNRIDFYRSLPRDRSRDTLHGAFLDVTVHSQDKRIFDVSAFRVRQSMDIAMELGLRGVIFHTNQIPNFRTPVYVQHWVDSNRDFWRALLEEYPKLEIFIENMFDEEPDMLHRLAVEMQGQERFGVCFDYAHASVFGENPEQWAQLLLPFTRHIHINDNDLKVDMHQSVGKGSIDWAKFNELLRKSHTSSSLLIEVNGLQKQEESLQYMKDHGIYPFPANQSERM